MSKKAAEELDDERKKILEEREKWVCVIVTI